LGTSNYYNDRDAFPRWQLLNAIANDPRTGSGTAVATTPDTITLIAWSDQPQLEISLGDDPFDSYATTLYFVEIPLTQNLISSTDAVTVPLSLLNWSVYDDGSGVHNPTIYDLYLSNAAAAFEFQPWPEFQAMEVQELQIMLGSHDTSATPPQIQLWNWEQESWEISGDLGWGQRPVVEFTRFVGPGNTIRIRLEDVSSQYGVSINEVYPILTGNLQ
jgi:hypothetical protein